MCNRASWSVLKLDDVHVLETLGNSICTCICFQNAELDCSEKPYTCGVSILMIKDIDTFFQNACGIVRHSMSRQCIYL